MISLTPSHIIEYLYCPRFTYFEYVLSIPQYEEKNYKVMQGRLIHEKKLNQNVEYLRKKIGVKEKYLNQYLSYGYLRGIIDEVLLLNDDTLAPLDYKFAEYKDRIYETYKTQLYCYAYLIEKNYNMPVNKGFLIYTRSKNELVEVEINSKNKDNISKAINGIYEIIDKNFYPRCTRYKKKCLICHYKNICV